MASIKSQSSQNLSSIQNLNNQSRNQSPQNFLHASIQQPSNNSITRQPTNNFTTEINNLIQNSQINPPTSLDKLPTLSLNDLEMQIQRNQQQQQLNLFNNRSHNGISLTPNLQITNSQPQPQTIIINNINNARYSPTSPIFIPNSNIGYTLTHQSPQNYSPTGGNTPPTFQISQANPNPQPPTVTLNLPSANLQTLPVVTNVNFNTFQIVKNNKRKNTDSSGIDINQLGLKRPRLQRWRYGNSKEEPLKFLKKFD